MVAYVVAGVDGCLEAVTIVVAVRRSLATVAEQMSVVATVRVGRSSVLVCRVGYRAARPALGTVDAVLDKNVAKRFAERRRLGTPAWATAIRAALERPCAGSRAHPP